MTSGQTMTLAKLVLPPVTSTHPLLNVTYRRPGYSIEYSPHLVRTRSDYYNSKAQITDGRMSTAAEELAIQLDYEIFANILGRVQKREIGIVKEPEAIIAMLESYAKERGEIEAIRYVIGVEKRPVEDPRNASVFDDLFGRNNPPWRAWQLTETFLRVPSGKSNPGKPDYTDPQGRKHWAREFGNGNEVAGIVYVPEGEGRVVPKTQDLFDVWDPITGLPRVTSDSENDMKYENHTPHFWFNPAPDKDSKSGHYDVAVKRWSHWHHGERGGCLVVGAVYGRWRALSADGFRPVRGPLPEIGKEPFFDFR